MKLKYLFTTFVLSLCLTFACLAQSQSTQSTITGIEPRTVLAPTIPGQVFTGTFTITGTNLQGGNITTDGPVLLVGSSRVNADGTAIQRDYQIGCCGPQKDLPDSIHNLTVHNAEGEEIAKYRINVERK